MLAGVVALATADGGADEPSSAAGGPGPEGHFEALLQEIGVLRSDLDRIDRKERGILGELDKLEVEASLRAREVQRLTLLREKTVDEHEDSRRRLEAVRRRAAQEEVNLAVGLRRAYELGRRRELALLLAVTEPVDLLRGLGYLDFVAKRQSGALGSLRESRSELEALERTLRAQAGSLEAMTAQQREKATALGGVRERSAEILRRVRQEQDAHRQAIAELARAAEELEAAIVESRSLYGGQGDGRASGPPAVDLARLKGTLTWPVPGRVKIPFGDVRHRKFGTITPHPGLDIETEPRSTIRSVGAGRVVFSRRFSAFGNTVLVDHGGQYLSVYARAAILSVAEGEEVVTGQALGLSADQGLDGGPPTVYFELRHKGAAVDPAPWLRRSSSIDEGGS